MTDSYTKQPITVMDDEEAPYIEVQFDQLDFVRNALRCCLCR